MAVKRTNQADCLEHHQNLLPHGNAWPRDEDAVLTKFLKAKATMQATTHNRAVDVLDEADPRTASEMFEDWERVLGLPDACVNAEQTIDERRAAILTKLNARGGQTPAYYSTLLTVAGFPNKVVEFMPFRAGRNVAGDKVGEANTWGIELEEQTIVYFLAGSGKAGQKLQSQSNEKVECLIESHKPAHTKVNYLYGAL